MSRWEAGLSERSQRMQPSAIRKMTKLAAAAGGTLITFAGGMPNPKTFPLEKLAQIASSEILEHHGKNLQYGMTSGYRPLVRWISEYLIEKGITGSPDQIVCTNGSQQAIDLIVEILIDPGDLIFVEAPTYIGALAVFQKSGADLINVSQDAGGVVLEDLEKKFKEAPAGKKKLLYLTSNFQNPSGISIATDRRPVIAQLLREYDAYLIEDDPYREVYFNESDRPAEPIQHWCPERVFYLGTFSKLVAPTFRTGWVVADSGLAPKIELAKETADLCSSLLDQRIVYQFCSNPDFGAHLQTLRTFYAERCRAMLDALREFMPASISWTEPRGGFFIWLTLPEYLDAESFLEESISDQKVTFVIGRAFLASHSAGNSLRLAFSVEDPENIREGIKRLASVIKRRLH
jgi:2-aminoadipate transaminase